MRVGTLFCRVPGTIVVSAVLPRHRLEMHCLGSRFPLDQVGVIFLPFLDRYLCILSRGRFATGTTRGCLYLASPSGVRPSLVLPNLVGTLHDQVPSIVWTTVVPDSIP